VHVAGRPGDTLGAEAGLLRDPAGRRVAGRDAQLDPVEADLGQRPARKGLGRLGEVAVAARLGRGQ
jgi:hypothetical protein